MTMKVAIDHQFVRYIATPLMQEAAQTIIQKNQTQSTAKDFRSPAKQQQDASVMAKRRFSSSPRTIAGGLGMAATTLGLGAAYLFGLDLTLAQAGGSILMGGLASRAMLSGNVNHSRNRWRLLGLYSYLNGANHQHRSQAVEAIKKLWKEGKITLDDLNQALNQLKTAILNQETSAKKIEFLATLLDFEDEGLEIFQSLMENEEESVNSQVKLAFIEHLKSLSDHNLALKYLHDMKRDPVKIVSDQANLAYSQIESKLN